MASGRHKVIYDDETETASLVIKNLCLEDGGEYNVVAKNEVGSDSQFINLHVKGNLLIFKLGSLEFSRTSSNHSNLVF